MRNRMYAIKNHKVLAIIDTAPYSEFAMNKLCKEIGASDWFELDENGALELMQVKKAEAQHPIIANKQNPQKKGRHIINAKIVTPQEYLKECVAD